MTAIFDEVVCRLDSDASKWNINKGELSLSIADMDFKAPPSVLDALRKRAQFGIFGYQDVSPLYFESFQAWWMNRHNTYFDCAWMSYSSGVVAALASMIRKLTQVQDQIVVLSPVYNVFYNIIRNNDREVAASELIEQGQRYKIDFEDLETHLQHPRTKMLLLCNPHNPTGNVWTKEELARIGELCVNHQVLVISDEVHCDITRKDVAYTPFLSVNESCKENSITCLSVGKTFNLAGLKSACIVCSNEQLRNTIQTAFNDDEIIEPNSFACDGAIAALKDGAKWLDSLREYIDENRRLVDAFLHEEIPMLSLVPADATYLLWVDCRKLCENTDDFCEFLVNVEGLHLSKGSSFGKNGAGFLRINAACPKSQLLDACMRLRDGCKKWQKQQ